VSDDNGAARHSELTDGYVRPAEAFLTRFSLDTHDDKEDGTDEGKKRGRRVERYNCIFWGGTLFGVIRSTGP